MTSMDVLRRGQFNRQPGKGIEYLISKALVDKSPASVAQFLRSTPSLCKAMIGDYLGQHEEFALAVMHAYVDSTEFSGMKFHSAIREFLEGFWLPGEAQKIDHIMEKFAERYCADNPGLFENADTAYVLAHAVIMLNTNAHNPMVCKMSKDDFIRMNTTSDAEESAPKELLEEIYDSIIKEEIKLKSDTSGLGKSGRQRSETEERGGLVSILNLALPRRDLVSDTKKESKDVIKQTQAFFRNQGVKRGVFHTAQHIELVRPMVEAVCWPLLATFSVTMEEGDNKPRVLHCTEGFKAGRHITRVLGMDTMRYAFLTSLVRFTFLHALKEMRSKNVEALRTIFSLSDSGSDNLQDTWNAVLECVSRLEYLTSTPGMASTVMQGSNQPSRDAVLNPIKELAWKPSEQVFVHSVKLNSDSVVEFFTALCGVSAEELKQTPAHVYSLQKLVEISYYNMARIGMEVCFMLPPLLGLLLDCAKQTDQAVVSISLGALVYLIEVVGHQFSDRDSNTLLKSIRDASYTTQPLELLNSLGFDGSKNQLSSARDSEVDMGGSPSLRSVRKSENHQFNNGENERLFGQAAPHIVNDSPGKHPSTSALQESEGLASPSGKGQEPAEGRDLQRTRTFGQRFMGNMMDNRLLRNLTSKLRDQCDG